MKLYGYGFKEEKIERYEMPIESLVLLVSRKLIENNLTDIEVRFVECFMGDVTRWDGMKGMLTHTWSQNYMISLYDIQLMHDNKDDFDYLKVVFADNIEGM